jgi:L-malate glycosyltransferase
LSYSYKKALANLVHRLPGVATAAGWLSGNAAPIFALHRVLPQGEGCYEPELVTSVELFSAFLSWISENYRAVPMEELVKLIHAERKSFNGKRPLCAITFDDGWRDALSHAVPLLKQHGLPATIFLPVQFIGTNRRFWQERLWFLVQEANKCKERGAHLDVLARSLPWCPRLCAEDMTYIRLRKLLGSRPSHEAEDFVDRLQEASGPVAVPSGPAFLNWDEVRALQDVGISFGSHTLSHRLLTRSDPETAKFEIERSRHELEDRLGAKVHAFSYPWGAASRLTRELVKEAGYGLAVTLGGKLANQAADTWLLPRIPLSSSILRGPNWHFQGGQMQLYLAWKALPRRDQVAVAATGKGVRERLHIAFLIDRMDWGEGGTEQQLSKLLHALDRQYFEPELCLFYKPVGFELEELPCPVYLTSCPPEGHWSRIRALLDLYKIFRRRRPQIVQTFFTDATVWGTLAASMARVPVIVSSRRNCGSFWQQDWSHRLALKLINGLVDSWQCNARVIYESLTANEGVPGEQIEILPNAVDLSGFSLPTTEERLAARRRLGLSPTAPVFVAVAHLRPIKDLPAILAAAARVKRELADAKFLVIGDGPLKASLQMQVEQLGLTGTVRLEGKQPDVRPYLAAADIGLLTSQSEGCSNALLEYMAMGLPAVVSDIPANRELVDEVVFETGNATDLADKLLSLWDDRAQRSRLQCEYRRRAEQYSLETFVQRAQSYYLKLAARCF